MTDKGRTGHITEARITSFDIVVCGLLVLFGVFFFFSYLRMADIVNDAAYPDLAKSLLLHHSYRSGFRPETMLPPGFPFILAVIAIFAGFTPAVFLHVVAVCATLGLLASYWLVRKIESNIVGAAACLLLASSPFLFISSTTLIFSDMPYFVLSISCILLALKLDQSKSARSTVCWMLLLSVTLVLTIMVRTVGIALVAAVATWVAASLRVDKAVARRRLMRFMLPAALGAAAMLVWTTWASHRRFSEWELPGYPQSYLSQLTIKNGNVPELGYAHLSDIPTRIKNNLVGWSNVLFEVLSHKEAKPFWPSPATAGIILILIGLLWSLWPDGGELYDWYFLIYATIYILWPWDWEVRFLLPVAPLAFVYIWRGVGALKHVSERRSKAMGSCLLAFGSVLSFASVADRTPIKWTYRDLSVFFWALIALLGCALLLQIDMSILVRRRGLRLASISVAVLAISLMTVGGVLQQMPMARANRTFEVQEGPFYGDIEASKWIWAHEPTGSVIMARKNDLVYHYSGDPAVWFPPISNATTLMRGIRKNHVQFVIVEYPRAWDYWTPTDQQAFNNLLQAYGSEFQLINSNPSCRI